MAQHGSITIDGNPNVKIDYTAKINSGVTKVENINFIEFNELKLSCYELKI